MEGRFGDDVHSPPEQILQISHEAPRKPGRAAWTHLYQEVEIAVETRLTARAGTEDTHIERTVFRGETENLLSLRLEDVFDFDGHAGIISLRVPDRLFPKRK